METQKRTRKRRGRGEGSIYEEGDGRWTGVVSFGVNPATGKRRRRKVHGQTKKEVQDKLRELQGKGPGEPCKLTVAQFLTRWLENTAREHIGENTYERYKRIVDQRLIPRLGGLRLTDLTAFHVEDFYADMKRVPVGAPSRHQAGMVLSTALKHAVRLRLIPLNPASEVARPRVEEREMIIMTDDQVRLFLAAARRSRYYALFALAVATGMRQGELLALQWPDVDFEHNTVTVRRTVLRVKGRHIVKEPKTRASRRTITVPGFAMNALHEHRKKMVAKGFVDRPVFCSLKGGIMSAQNLRKKTFKPILARAGLPNMRFHDLRHTHASTLLSKGKSIKAVSRRLGHSNISTTLEVYAHVLPGDDLALADAVQTMYG
jgi:integrase